MICVTQVVMLTLGNAPPSLDVCADLHKQDYSKYSKTFRKMTARCLTKDPSER